jgi:integrase/recombinase XerD
VRKAYRDMNNGRYVIRDLALIAVLVFTGCRLGEALELARSDIDFKGRTIRIRQRKKRTEFVRLVPVPAPLFWEIMDIYIWRVEHKLFPISDRQARNIVYRFSERYLKKRIRPHAIRHSYAIAVLEKTRNIEVVRRLLGHATYGTLKFYLDYTQRDLEEYLSEVFA